MSGLASLSLSLVLFSPPGSADPAPAHDPPHELRARRFFVASGVVMGASLLGEMAGAIISTTCKLGSACTTGFMYQWGSDDAGTRYTVITTGIGSAYVLSRAVSIPLVWTGEGLLLAGAHFRALADADAGRKPATKRLAWALLGSGLGLYVGSRLARFGFALGGVCQDLRCVYAFDQVTLGVSRGLSFSGSALVMHRRTHRRVQLGLAPTAFYGLALTGQF
ncbi:MAG: hypothetical protein R6X02_32395 [Enhygromyxa sp.]